MLAYEMARRRARRGLVSIYAAGGMAGAFLLARSSPMARVEAPGSLPSFQQLPAFRHQRYG
jgi:hypothetical protein